MVSNQPDVADFAHVGLREEIINFTLLSLQVNSIHEHGAVISLSLFGLSFGLFQVLNQVFLLATLFLIFVGAATLVTAVVRAVTAPGLALLVIAGWR